MISIDEINVGMTGRAEDYGVAQGTTGGGMGSWVFDTQVGLDLYDASGEVYAHGVADQDLAKELAGYAAGITDEEGARDRLGIKGVLA